MNKKDMTEQDIRTKYITPAIISAGWDRDLQIREEVSFTNGKVIVRRKTVKRGEKKRADYILYWKPNIPIAIVEAKDNKHSIGDGMEQALKYAEILDILASVYLIAAAPSPSTEPKFPCPSISIYLIEKSCAILTIAS